MINQQKYIFVSRYIFFIGVLFGTLLKVPASSYAPFILLYLILVINSQVRISYLKDKFTAISIIVEAALVLYINYCFGGFVYLIVFVGMIDAYMFLKNEPYTLSVFSGLCLAYMLYKDYPAEWFIILLSFYAIVVLFLLQLRKELKARKDTESLYDQIRRYTYELEATRSRLLEYSKQIEKVAQLEERNRISRELHDSIGHSLTGILMQVDACMQIIQINKEKGIELLKSVYENINCSIEIVRHTVTKLRPSEYRTNLQALKYLIEKFRADTGVNVEFRLIGTPYEIFPSIETAIFRNAQEAMTNAVRHGHARNILINLLYKTDSIELTISNDGLDAGTIKKGFGLSGIEDRMELIGGTVSFNGEKGFTVHMSIPVNEALEA